jgi:hypothetical protein
LNLARLSCLLLDLQHAGKLIKIGAPARGNLRFALGAEQTWFRPMLPRDIDLPTGLGNVEEEVFVS